jgi:hypothetical protein
MTPEGTHGTHFLYPPRAHTLSRHTKKRAMRAPANNERNLTR